jgi:hypothetical protein
MLLPALGAAQDSPSSLPIGANKPRATAPLVWCPTTAQPGNPNRRGSFENEIQGGNKILRFFKSIQAEITWLTCLIKFIFRTNYFDQ